MENSPSVSKIVPPSVTAFGLNTSKEYFKTWFSDIEDHPLLPLLEQERIPREALETLNCMLTEKDYKVSDNDYRFDKMTPVEASDEEDKKLSLFYFVAQLLQQKKMTATIAAVQLGFNLVIDEFWADLSQAQKVEHLGCFLAGLDNKFKEYLSTIEKNEKATRGLSLLHYLTCYSNYRYLPIAKEKYDEGYFVLGSKGDTLFHAVAFTEPRFGKEKKEKTIQFLLDQELKIDARTELSATPLMIAAQRGNEITYGILKEHGAKDQIIQAEIVLNRNLGRQKTPILQRNPPISNRGSKSSWKLFFTLVILAVIGGVVVWRWIASRRATDPTMTQIFKWHTTKSS